MADGKSMPSRKAAWLSSGTVDAPHPRSELARCREIEAKMQGVAARGEETVVTEADGITLADLRWLLARATGFPPSPYDPHLDPGHTW